MQLSLDIIDAFRSMSHTIAFMFMEIHISANSFSSKPILLMPNYKMTDDELICYFGDNEIGFSNVIPSKILAIEVDAPIILREDVEDIQLKTWNNSGSTPENYTHRYLEEETTTESLDIASEIGMAIKAKVGGSYAGFSAELESQLSAKLGITHKSQTEIHHSDEETLSIVVPPYKSVSLTQKHSVTDFKQKVATTCEIDANVRIKDNGLAPWEKKLGSLRELQLYFQGGGGGTGDNTEALDAFMTKRLFSGFELPYQRTQFTIERERIYRNVKTSETNRTEVDA